MKARTDLDPRRAQERQDGRIIQEDHSAMANLSPIPITREWQRPEEFADIWNDAIYIHATEGVAKRNPMGR
jgi:hypothetical protein